MTEHPLRAIKKLADEALKYLSPTAMHPVRYPFRQGSVRGSRVQLDNRDDDYVFDVFAWRKGEDVISVTFQYKTGDAEVMHLLAPVLARSIR